ncbi:MAG: T9SS type A sorting domain-containing protein [Bacteroidales bacterium]|nr:T9SS type A sorting domain-containing protein [Bacteroidales bacterium]
MKKALLFLILLAFGLSFQGISQTCGQVGLIGEFNAWAEDHFMDRDPMNPNMFSTILSLTSDDDTDGDAIVKMKFRENADWTVNWGDTIFPAGVAMQDGGDIPVPVDTATTATTDYFVTFNCETGEYSFVDVCGSIGITGEFLGWADDLWMTRNTDNLDEWSVILSLSPASNQYGAEDTIEVKFRESADWAVNWGGPDFPSGIGVQEGPNILVPIDTSGVGGLTTDYLVTFNCSTGEYNFEETNGQVSLIGEFIEWNGDILLDRDADNPNLWSVIFSLTPEHNFYGAEDTIEVKFRENADWSINWGGPDFPSGIGVQEGPNILVPIDTSGTTGLTTDYFVTFNSLTGEYNFEATCGPISMIGAFNGWNGDVPMNRDADDPNAWTLTRSWYADSEVKFRENADWTYNWGGATFPSGIGVNNGPDNIPLLAGIYDVTFNCNTLDYNFVENVIACGEIGMVGEFNEWGNDGTDVPTDVYLVRDPMYPTLFSLTYNFSSTTELLFRVDADITFQNVWGGTYPGGAGVYGDPLAVISVPGGKYHITFNCVAGDFYFERLGNAITAPEVFAINVDGELSEADWDLSQNVSQVVEGDAGEYPNEVIFGTAWNESYFYFGVDVADSTVTDGDIVHVFIDADKDGGDYDDSDIQVSIDGAGTVTIVQGSGTVVAEWFDTEKGYSVEVGVAFADLMIIPETGAQLGVDVIVGDDDGNDTIAYYLAWNGNMDNLESTNGFGDCNLGVLACGCISLYNETIGYMVLKNPTDMPTTYVATYEIFEDQNVVFMKDFDATVFWGATDFPEGYAELGGDNIPATPGRYRITFDCLTGEYTFDLDNTPAEGIAYADRTEDPATIDGDLSEYSLNYTSDVLVAGAGPINNTVIWGALWDSYNLYLGVEVEDAVIEGTGNPWDNDAIEYYFDGNHDQDGTYDGDFDTQLIQDFLSASASDDTLWIKADGVQFTSGQFDAKWMPTGSGYNLELRLSWSIFDFRPGKGRTMGFSMGNNDSDLGLGRDYQSVWYGTGSNWSNTADLGDLQLAGGPYFDVKEVFYNDQMALFPNPTNGNVTIKSLGDVFQGEMTFYVSDISGRTIIVERDIFSGTNDMITLKTDQLDAGIYFVNIIAADGKKALKKLIVR